MNLILFIHKASCTDGSHFKKVLTQNLNPVNIETIPDIHAFKERLKKTSNYDDDVFILFADCQSRLKTLSGMMDLLDGKRLILVLPDDTQATTSLAHRFFPRFFTFISATYTDLCDVLNKMISQTNNQHRRDSK